MTNVTSGMRFEVSHRATTPEDASLVGADDIAAYMLIDSVAISTATSKAVSTVNAAAPDSSSISQAKSQAVSAAVIGTAADSKAVSVSGNTSVADSKALSVSGSTSMADSKAVSVANSVPILTVVAASQSVSIAQSTATSVATNLNPLPSDSRLTATTHAYLDNNKTLNVRDFSTSVISTGVTSARAAFLAAIASGVASGARRIRIPDGNYLIDGEVSIPAGIELVGDSMAGTIITHRPAADGICFKVTASAAIAYYTGLSNLSIYSDDTTHTKVAIELNDVSSAKVERINIYGTGTGTPTASYYSGGTGSIGLRTKGREATGLKDIKIVADYPIYIDANPNTARTDGEDIDHWHGENFYLVANGHYSITVADGLGIISLTLAGYQAWVGGTGGFYMNDTRVAPTIVSRHLTFANIRGEQCQDANGYWFNITATGSPIQTVELRNILGASTAQGIKIDGCLQLLLDNVTMATAAGKNSLLVQGATGGSVISMRGCYWQPSSVVTLTGYTATAIEAYNSALVASPGTATYVNTAIGGTLVNVGKLTANATAATVGLLVQATSSGDNLQVLPQAAGSGASVRANNNAQTDFTPLSLTGSTIDFRYRTGVATSASAASVDTSGTLLTGKVQTTVTAATTAYLALGAAGGDGLQILPNAAAAGASVRAVNNTVADFTPLSLIGSTLDIRNRTGVGTSASAIQMDASGNLSAQNDLKVSIVGKGLYVKEGANATMGRAVLVAGTVVVSTTKVTANSEIFLTHQNSSGVAGFLVVSARSASTSFTILSSNASDTSTIAWLIVEPA